MRYARKARALGLALAGLLVGMLFITPATAHFTTNTRHLGVHAWNQVIRERADNRYVRLNQVFTRNFSCAGTTFTPLDSLVDYATTASLRYRTSTEGNGIFRCNVVLPDGARVVRVAFSVRDTSATGSVFACTMWRTNDATGIGTETQMANAGGTGAGATPGNVQLGTISITQPVINNNLFSYFVQCAIDGTTTTTGIFGANVRYRVTGGGGTPAGAAAAAGAASGISSAA